MPRSSKHKSHKSSKHSSKDHSNSEDDVVKKKGRSVRLKDDSSSRVRHGNGEVLEEYVSSKRRKEKLDVVDRWGGGEIERPDGNGNFEKEAHIEGNLKDGSRSKESSDKVESLRIESKSKSKKYESGNLSESKGESLTSALLDKEEGSGKWDSRRKHEKDSLARKEWKESKEKHRRSDREENGGGQSNNGETEVKLVDSDYGKEHESQSGGVGEENQRKRARENTERTMMDDLRNPDSDYEIDKKSRKRREVLIDGDKYYDDPKHVEDRRSSAKSDRVKDVKRRDDKQKDGGYAEKYRGEHYKDDRRRDERNREEADKDYYYYDDDKHQGDAEKDHKRRDDRHREDIKKSHKHKDGKHPEEHGGSQRKDDKYREAVERDGRRDNKYQDDGHRDSRRKECRYDEDDDKESRRADGKYHGHGEREDRHGYGEGGHRDRRDEKNNEDIEHDTHQYDSKKMDDFDKEKRHGDTKYRDEYVSKHRFGDKSEQKRSRDDDYAGTNHSKKSTACDDSSNHDDPTRYRTNENENGSRSGVSKDQRSDVEKRSTVIPRPELVAERGRSTFRSSVVELSSSHSRRKCSPTSRSYAPRDYDRLLNSDEPKYRDYKHEDKVRLDKTSSRDYVEGSEKILPPQSSEPLAQKDDVYLDRSSLQKHADKSPSSSMGRRNFSREDVIRLNVSVEDLTQKGGGSREERQYSAKDVRVNRESGIEVPHGDELSLADGDSLSISSPFTRNNNLSGSSKPPPPIRTGLDSPSPFGSAEDDARGRSHIRPRRNDGDPHMGRISGHGWRGITSWPSPMANSFLPFPHANPIAFPSAAMQPFPSPPMFGVHPSMEFPGPGHPIGWRNQVNHPFPSLNAWDASNATFGQQPHMYGRQDSDRSRILPAGSKLDDIGHLSKGPNRTESVDRSYSEKENSNYCRSGDVVSADDVEVDSTVTDARLSKKYKKNDVEVPIVEEINGEEAILKKNDEYFCQVYLSKLDISADLAEPELFAKCTSLVDVDRDVLSDADNVKFLYVENAVESKRAFHRLLSYKVFESVDDSVYEESISLYKRSKESIDDEKSTLLSGLVEATDIVEEPEKMLNPPAIEGATDALQSYAGVKEDRLQNEERHEENEQQKPNMSCVVGQVEGKEPSPEEENGEYAHSSLPIEPDSHNVLNEESKLIDSKCDPPFVISDMMPSEALDISRIHNHSPESTH